ncbi:mediator complex subunit [Knufia obscura]|uniref:Mediator of RNA polymerase II transcription subunit 5 n=1 Tax=Knufia obscura TaxID=1635080 RepID=A0ABR0RRP4_9EURO|nr:mediator complex subunit [Knufia obscura]
MARSHVSILVRQCLHQRVPPHEFEELLRLANKKWHPASIEIVASLVTSASSYCLASDPLVSGYLQVILTSQLASVSDCLSTCIKAWQHRSRNGGSETTHHARILAQFITDLTLLIPSLLSTTSEGRTCIILSSRWLRTLFHLAAGPDAKQNDEQINVLVGAICLFLITLMNTTAGATALKHAESSREDPVNVAIRQALDGSMATFPDVSMRLLTEAQKHSALLEPTNPAADHAQAADMGNQFESTIADAQIVPTRAATYALLYTKLQNASTIDDNALVQFLSARYPGNNGLAFNDLLFSSFDVLSKPSSSFEPMYQAQCRIYLHNKLPAVLALIASFEPLPTEQYLQELWNDLSTLGNSEVASVAKHFLHICVHHRLISADTVQNLTGEDLNSTSAKGLFPKQALVDQVSGNASRGPRLVDELAKNDGNAGPVGLAIVEIVHKYCQAKETQHLKDMANALVRLPSTIHSLGMFVKPSYFLSPFCKLIDEWAWDIHGESQPIYEEFGSILLLIMTVKFRLGLANQELGLSSSSGFVAQYLSSGQSERRLQQLTEGEAHNLGEWIHNLYDSEGISDDVTTNCSAKEFHLMVPTLLRQSMTAFSKGNLSQDKLEGGLDYLLEPFLLPSLLSAFAWLARAVMKDTNSATVIIRRLAKAPESSETSRLHRTILDIAHGMFRRTLSQVLDQPQYAEVMGLFGGASPFTVNTGVKANDLSMWTNGAGGITSYLRRVISDLLAISSAGIFQPDVIVATSLVRGPGAVVHALVELLVQYAANQQFAQLLDIIATIIASTDSTGVSLRNSLQLLHARLGKFLKKGDNLFAEALVHLHRRIEFYATALTPQPGGDDTGMIPVEAADLAEINLDQIPLDPEPPKQQPVQMQEPDSLAGEDMEQMLNEAANMGNIDDYTTNEDNMFNMDMDNYELANLDDLDMSMF